MRGDADGAGDFFAPVKVGEEMLAEALASHGWNSVAGGAGSAARSKEVTKQGSSRDARKEGKRGA